MTIYLANTFSPMMLATGTCAGCHEVDLVNFKKELEGYEETNGVISAISHEITSLILSALLGREVIFNRTNVALKSGDVVLCIIPNFRATEAREFTREEVEAAGYRCFVINAR